MSMSSIHDEKMAALKMGGGVAGLTIYGITLNEWVAICTILYFVLQIGLLLPKYWYGLRRWWRGRGGCDE